jgi:hypothetical protein
VSGARSGPVGAVLSPPRLIVQFGRMGLREMATAGHLNADDCVPLPNVGDPGYTGNGTVDLVTAIKRLNRRYGNGGPAAWPGWGPLGGTVGVKLLYPGMPGDPNYSREACGPHKGVLGDANEGTILYPSWADLASPALSGVALVTAGGTTGGLPGNQSGYGDGTWTDASIAADIRASADTLASEGHPHGLVQMAWPPVVPGCASGAANCRVTDAATGENLVPDEVARRMAEGCVAGQQHTEYVANVPYISTCGATYPPVVATNRIYTNDTRRPLNSDPLVGRNTTGRCPGPQVTQENCWYLNVWSLAGGKCNSTTDACASLSIPDTNPFGGRTCTPGSTPPNCYERPADVTGLADLTAARGGFFVLQGYRFVEGSYRDQINPTERKSWNCTGPVDTHWTSVPEDYCWKDMIAILDRLKADGYLPVGVDWPMQYYRPGFPG